MPAIIMPGALKVRNIEKLPPGLHADGNGLYLRVTTSGKRYWILRAYLGRDPCRNLRLGWWPVEDLRWIVEQTHRMRMRGFQNLKYLSFFDMQVREKLRSPIAAFLFIQELERRDSRSNQGAEELRQLADAVAFCPRCGALVAARREYGPHGHEPLCPCEQRDYQFSRHWGNWTILKDLVRLASGIEERSLWSYRDKALSEDMRRSLARAIIHRRIKNPLG